MGKHKKRGQLSLEERAYIKEHVHSKSAQDIAKALNRNIGPILKYIENNDLGRKLFKSHKDKQHFLTQLKQQVFWEHVERALTSKEQEQFADFWAEAIEQVQGDILPTEKISLRDFIIISIQQNRTEQSLKYIQQDMNELEQKIAKELKRPPHRRDDVLLANAKAGRDRLLQTRDKLQKDIKTWLSEKKVIQQQLKIARDQRIAQIENAKANFTSYLKYLDEEENRDKEGRTIELLKMAGQKEYKNLTQSFVYADGKIDYPIYNSDVVNNEKKEE